MKHLYVSAIYSRRNSREGQSLNSFMRRRSATGISDEANIGGVDRLRQPDDDAWGSEDHPRSVAVGTGRLGGHLLPGLSHVLRPADGDPHPILLLPEEGDR